MADCKIIILGAGLAGLGMAAQLQRQLNEHDFEIYEKLDDVGGTWAQNKYPNLSCDMPSEVRMRGSHIVPFGGSSTELTTRTTVLLVLLLPKPRLESQICRATRNLEVHPRLRAPLQARLTYSASARVHFTALV
jgi:phytoene dehydrogenase-like protein